MTLNVKKGLVGRKQGLLVGCSGGGDKGGVAIFTLGARGRAFVFLNLLMRRRNFRRDAVMLRFIELCAIGG